MTPLQIYVRKSILLKLEREPKGFHLADLAADAQAKSVRTIAWQMAEEKIIVLTRQHGRPLDPLIVTQSPSCPVKRLKKQDLMKPKTSGELMGFLKNARNPMEWSATCLWAAT